jgi:hypothetical protein
MPTKVDELLAKERYRLATERGTYRCMGRCKQLRPLAEGLVTYWGGNILFSICPECFSGIPVVMEERVLSSGKLGIWVGPLRKEDRAQDLVIPATSIESAKEIIPKHVLAKYEKDNDKDEE